jgi:hypothetical protein
MTWPTIPANVQEYFWKLVMSGMFVLAIALTTKYLGSSAPPIPAPTIQVVPMVVQPGEDGTMRILSLEPARK